jgi:hypothetical protein
LWSLRAAASIKVAVEAGNLREKFQKKSVVIKREILEKQKSFKK